MNQRVIAIALRRHSLKLAGLIVTASIGLVAWLTLSFGTPVRFTCDEVAAEPAIYECERAALQNPLRNASSAARRICLEFELGDSANLPNEVTVVAVVAHPSGALTLRNYSRNAEFDGVCSQAARSWAFDTPYTYDDATWVLRYHVSADVRFGRVEIAKFLQKY